MPASTGSTPGAAFLARPRPAVWQRWIQRLAVSRWITPAAAPFIDTADRALLRLSRDRLCLTTLLTGLPVLLVTTAGARTGRPRTHPLTALQDDDRFALIASNFGRSRYPGWYHNLRAHPVAQIRMAGQRRPFQARRASPEERARFWAMAVDLYPGYVRYEQRAAPRPVPVIILEPTEAKTSG